MKEIKVIKNIWIKENLFDNPFEDQPHPHGIGFIKTYRFDNDYGASVIRFKLPGYKSYASYTSNENEFELGVLKFDDSGHGWLFYDSPLTNDVLGHLSKEEVEDALRKIKSWKKNQY